MHPQNGIRADIQTAWIVRLKIDPSRRTCRNRVLRHVARHASIQTKALDPAVPYAAFPAPALPSAHTRVAISSSTVLSRGWGRLDYCAPFAISLGPDTQSDPASVVCIGNPRKPCKEDVLIISHIRYTAFGRKPSFFPSPCTACTYPQASCRGIQLQARVPLPFQEVGDCHGQSC